MEIYEICEEEYCGYCWKEDGEDYPTCHYNGPLVAAPCEYDREEYENEY